MPCPDCGCEPFKVGPLPGDYMCICDLEGLVDDNSPYINHCWNCQCEIDSRVCEPSPILGMGYLCNACGKDLTEWKRGLQHVTVL